MHIRFLLLALAVILLVIGLRQYSVHGAESQTGPNILLCIPTEKDLSAGAKPLTVETILQNLSKYSCDVPGNKPIPLQGITLGHCLVIFCPKSKAH